MEYIKIGINSPLEFTMGGQFISNEPWSHMKRTMDCFELIIGLTKTLYLKIDELNYEVSPGDILLLPPNRLHEGYDKCEAGISFYWFHFHCQNDVVYINNTEMDCVVKKLRSIPYRKQKDTSIFIPIFSTPNNIDRLYILCHQLLDVTNSNYYSSHAADYLATSILIELSEQFITNFHTSQETNNKDKTLTAIKEWIRVHSMDTISVSSIAEHFNYNRNYLSRFFKTETGINLKDYIHMMKIAKAKDLLIRSKEGIKEISETIGIQDEKYFMRLFKKYENITPTEFRKAYYRIPLNKE